MSSSTSVPRIVAAQVALLPVEVVDLLRKIMLDRWTGNVQLNIREGRILGLRKEEVINLSR